MLSTLTCLVFGAAALGQLPRVSIDPHSQQFVDDHGRVRIFHGLNAVYKLQPFHPDTQPGYFNPNTSLSDIDIANLREWGFNAMRVGVMWRAVEPAPLQYNHTYLEIMRELVDSLGAAGIYSLIDSHQDDMSRKFCGEGFPDFAAMPAPWASKGGDYSFPAPLPLNITTASDGYPNLTECQEVGFFLYQASFALATAWGNFFNSSLPYQSLFINYWRQVAATFNTTGSILGYEVRVCISLESGANYLPRALLDWKYVIPRS